MGNRLLDTYKRDAHAMYNKTIASMIKDPQQPANQDKYIDLMHQYMLNEYGFNYLLAIEFNSDMYEIYGALKNMAQNFYEMELRASEHIYLFHV